MLTWSLNTSLHYVCLVCLYHSIRKDVMNFLTVFRMFPFLVVLVFISLQRPMISHRFMFYHYRCEQVPGLAHRVPAPVLHYPALTGLTLKYGQIRVICHHFSVSRLHKMPKQSLIHRIVASDVTNPLPTCCIAWEQRAENL